MKTFLVNLTIAEIESITCQYVKNCGAKTHHRSLIKAQAKMLKILEKSKEKEGEVSG